MIRHEQVIESQGSSFNVHVRRLAEFPFEWHYHPEYELVAITRGYGKRFIGDNIEEYSAGDIVLTGPNLAHSWQSLDSSGKIQEAIVVQFTRDFLGNDLFDQIEFAGVNRILKRAERGLLFFTRPDKLIRLLRKITSTQSLDRLIAFLSILRELEQLKDQRVLCSAGFSPLTKQSDNLRISKALNFINEHINEQLKQKQVADTVNMSRAGFSRFFKRCTGKRFSDYLIDMRIGYACRLLLDTDKTVTEICFETGFLNISNFNRQFLKHKRMNPTQYRKEHSI